MRSNLQTSSFSKDQKVTVSTIKALGSSVQEVEFYKCKIEPEEWGLILEALSEKPQIISLKIQKCWAQFSKEQNICHIQKIKKLTNLTKLTLSQCNIDAKGAQAISNLNLPCLTVLDLMQNSIGDQGCRALAKIQSLTHLKLSKSSVTDIGVGYLSQLTNLQKLQLCWSNIGLVGVAHLTRFKNLRTLNLHQSNITDQCAKTISKMFSLRQLWLKNNPIGTQGVLALCRMKDLQLLDLSNNKLNHEYCNIGNEGIQGIRKLKKLKLLYLCQSNFDSSGACFIGRMLSLTGAVILGNEIIPREKNQIRRRLWQAGIN